MEQPLYIRAAYFLLFLGLAALLLYVGRPILIPSLAALLFAFLVLPIIQKLETWKFPPWLAALSGVLTVIASVATLFCLLSWQIMSFTNDLPSIKETVNLKMKSLNKYVEAEAHISRRTQTQWIEEKTTEMLDNASGSIFSVFGATGAALATVALIPIFMFFLLLYRPKFKQFLKLLDPDRHEHVLVIVRKISKVSQHYIRGMFIVICILSVLNAIGFLLLDLKYAFLLGMLAAVLNIIPYVGVLIGSLFPIIIALVTKDSLMYAVGALGVCVFVQFLENNFITPKIVGSSVNLNPLASIVTLLLGGMLWGLPGMVLAIPVGGMFKVICDNVKSLHSLGFLLGEEREYKPFQLPARFRRAKKAA